MQYYEQDAIMVGEFRCSIDLIDDAYYTLLVLWVRNVIWQDILLSNYNSLYHKPQKIPELFVNPPPRSTNLRSSSYFAPITETLFA